MSARTRPTMTDWHMARDLEWYEQHPDWFLHEWDGQWTVFESDNPLEQKVYCVMGTLREAIRVARRLLRDSDG
jgi:hypothetical protein